MTRWAMVADLGRCVGCQTCVAACRHANATSTSVQWRKVLDVEVGAYPDVRRTFVPVGCMHCREAPCTDVCPSTATRRRPDGVVTMDYDLCIGCAYCAIACPYQARYKVDAPAFAYGATRLKSETVRERRERVGVAQKCTFCSDRVDDGLARGLRPGVDPDATPACVNSCIADALHFGDLDDAASNVSQLLAAQTSFRMHEELGTEPGLHYVYGPRSDGADAGGGDLAAPSVADTDARGRGANGRGANGRGANGGDADGPDANGGDADGPEPYLAGVAPWRQTHWDWRAAANFMAGGTGTGLLAATALAALGGVPAVAAGLVGLAFVAAGLFCVWLEIGKKWRFINVLFHPQTSWMTREAALAGPLFAAGIAAAWLASPTLFVVTGALALGFLYCQARMIHAAKGIPVWREDRVVPLVVATGLTEGTAVLLCLTPFLAAPARTASIVALVLAVLLGLRVLAWQRYRRAVIAAGAPRDALHELAALHRPLAVGGHAVPAVLLLAGLLVAAIAPVAFIAAGLGALAGGWLLKFRLIVRASYNQGFAIRNTPARGGGVSGPGLKPGWSMP